MNQVYLDTARLLTQVAPLVFVDDTFALKGGTAINLFVRDMPRLSVDLDLVFPDHTLPRVEALARINEAVRQATERLKKRGFQTHAPAAVAGETKLLVRRGSIQVKVEVNFVMRGTVQPVRRASDIGWASPLALCLFAAGLRFITLFVFVEHRSGDPLLPPAMLSNKYLRVALISGALFMATFGSVLYFLSIFFQIVMGFDALQTGFVFLLPTVVVVASSTLAGRAVTRFGLRNVMAFALGVGSLGAVALGRMLARGEPLLALVPCLVAISIGDGTMFTAIFIAAATKILDRHQGVASGMVSTSQGIGAAMGLAVLVLIANAAGSAMASKSLRVATEQGTARVAYAIAAGMLLTLLMVAVLNPMKAQDAARTSAAKQDIS